jgi:hypothetical protein
VKLDARPAESDKYTVSLAPATTGDMASADACAQSQQQSGIPVIEGRNETTY